LRLKARLVDGRSGYVVWSGSFDREPRDIFTVQADLAAAIVNAIVPTARGETAPAAAPPSSTELSAYDLYLIGRQGQWQRTPDAIHRALAALERSVELNPNFAPAQAQLALTLITGVSYANLAFQESYQRAEVAARRALALDSRLAAGHVALAIALTVTEQKTAADVLPMLERAIELNPNDAMAMFRYSGFLGQVGRIDESRRWAEKSLEVDPLAGAPRGNMICDLHLQGARRRTQAEEARYERLFADDAEGMTSLARIRMRCLGDPAGAARAAMAATHLLPTTPTPTAMLYLHRALVAVGASDEARSLREGTDWLTTSPDNWTYAQALEAGTTGDPAARDLVIEAMRRLPPSPVRDAALVYWLADRSRAADATGLLDSAEHAGPLRLYVSTGLERDLTDAADLCVRLHAQPRPARLAQDIAALRADMQLESKGNPPLASSWVAAAMLASCEGDDTLAVDSLRHAFAVDALPAGFAPQRVWFSRLQGRPEYNRMVAQWSAEQARTRAALLAAMRP
jgi:tetratricopeptide (TPR) repeat protein